MNPWLILLILVFLFFLAVKVLKNIIKVIILIVLLAGVLIFGNYFVLPKIGGKSAKLGLEGIFRSKEIIKETKEKIEKFVEEKKKVLK